MMTEELVGVDVVLRSIKAPFMQVMKNSGEEHHSYMEKIINSKNKLCGFDALNGSFVTNMIDAGIIDPVKVVRTALQNAASASGTLLTTEVTVSSSEQKSE